MYGDEIPIVAPIILIILFLTIIFLAHSGKRITVTVIQNEQEQLFVSKDSPYYKLGVILTDSEMSLPETRIDNYFWLFEEDQYILLDGEVLYFLVKTKRPDIIIELSETPFEFP